MIILLLKLLLAHITGDFLLQPLKWVEDKERKKYKSKYLYYHMFIHLIALIIVLEFDFSYWLAIVIIIPSHYLVDVIKTYLSTSTNKRLLFGIDQLVHLLVIAGVVAYYHPNEIDLQFMFSPSILLIAVFIILNTSVSSIIMKVIFSKWNIDNRLNKDSLEKAGTYIGMLERLLVFTFIIVNQWASIGFLLAAKSIFRFGDLSRAEDRKLTEYVLIGTLISFGIAIILGLTYQKIYSFI